MELKSAPLEVCFATLIANQVASVGCRLAMMAGRLISTISANPIMGHVQLSHVTAIAPLIRMASRFDYNLYSQDSDVVVGLEADLKSADSSTNVIGDCVNFRCSWRHGLAMAVRWSSQMMDSEAITMSLGISSGPLWTEMDDCCSISAPISFSNKATISLELSMDR